MCAGTVLGASQTSSHLVLTGSNPGRWTGEKMEAPGDQLSHGFQGTVDWLKAHAVPSAGLIRNKGHLRIAGLSLKPAMTGNSAHDIAESPQVRGRRQVQAKDPSKGLKDLR